MLTEWLAGLGLPRIPKALVIVWMLYPAFQVWQAVVGLFRRWRLRTSALDVEATIVEVRPFVPFDTNAESTIVDLVLRYEVEGRDYRHQVTRSDHVKAQYTVGDPIDLICELGRPMNVVDAQRRPWDDVMGPLVFSLLLFMFMGWLALVVVGIY